MAIYGLNDSGQIATSAFGLFIVPSVLDPTEEGRELTVVAAGHNFVATKSRPAATENDSGQIATSAFGLLAMTNTEVSPLTTWMKQS